MTAASKRTLFAIGVYLLACVLLAVVHDGLMFGWLADVPRNTYKPLLPIAGPGLALNTHLSVILFVPLAAVLAIPLVVSVRSAGYERAIAIAVFATGWIAAGLWLAKLF